MKIIIPSKDRPMQLHLLLESMEKNNITGDIFVIGIWSNKKFEEGYRRLLKNDLFRAEWLSQNEFKQTFDNLLIEEDYVCLLTDDSIFYRKPDHNVEDILSQFNESTWCFSYRLGLNTYIQNYIDGEQQPRLSNYQENNGFISWNWQEKYPYHNYGYYISWDGHIYKSSDLLKICSNKFYRKPRDFESELVKNISDRYSVGKRKMMCEATSSLVVNTINAVQDNVVRAGVYFSYSADELNQKYLDGEVIDIERMDFSNIFSSHTERELKFK